MGSSVLPLEKEVSARVLQEEFDCSTIVVTGIYPGTYEEHGSTGLRADYLSSSSSSSNQNISLHFQLDPVRRGRRLEDRVEASPHAESGLTSEAIHDVDTLRACDPGTWVLAPTDESYPKYEVWDCAVHPTDISNPEWYVSQCSSCDAVLHNASAEIECAAEIGAIGPVVTGPTPSPVPTLTRNPIIEIWVPETLSPVASEEQESSNCTTVEVTNGVRDGEYSLTSYSSDGRPNFQHNSGAWLFWGSFISSTSGSDANGFDNNFVLDFGNRRLTSEAATWSAELNIPRSRRLESCFNGAWVLSTEDDYIPYWSPDCAMHPVDIDSIWLEWNSAAEAWQGKSPQAIIRCSGSDSSSSSETGAMPQDVSVVTSGGVKVVTAQNIEGRDESSGMQHETSADVRGISAIATIVMGTVVAAIILVVTGTIFVWRYRSRRRQTQKGSSPDAEHDEARASTVNREAA